MVFSGLGWLLMYFNSVASVCHISGFGSNTPVFYMNVYPFFILLWAYVFLINNDVRRLALSFFPFF